MRPLAAGSSALFSLACAALFVIAWVVIVMFALAGSGLGAGMVCIVEKTQAFNRWLDQLNANDGWED